MCAFNPPSPHRRTKRGTKAEPRPQAFLALTSILGTVETREAAACLFVHVASVGQVRYLLYSINDVSGN